MEPSSIILFSGLIVSTCILGGAIYSGLVRIADALNSKNPKRIKKVEDGHAR